MEQGSADLDLPWSRDLLIWIYHGAGICRFGFAMEQGSADWDLPWSRDLLIGIYHGTGIC